MTKIILEIEDKPDGSVAIKGRTSRPLPYDHRDMSKAETIAGRLLVFMREELGCYHSELH